MTGASEHDSNDGRSVPVDADLQALVVSVNGFVYPGHRLDAVLATVTWLKSHPAEAARLLDLEVSGER